MKAMNNKGADLKGVLPAPQRALNIPQDAQWLSGEGCGSWFYILVENDRIFITRYSPDGVVECSGQFKNLSEVHFDSHAQYHVTYMSHCAQVSVIQAQTKIILSRIK